ncbi:hypothetical protein ACKI1O_45360 [Streptomyces scabiei]
MSGTADPGGHAARAHRGEPHRSAARKGELEHQQASQRWAFRQTVVYHLASRSGLRTDDIVVSQVPGRCLLEAALTVRRLVKAADPAAEFLAATAFLETGADVADSRAPARHHPGHAPLAQS